MNRSLLLIAFVVFLLSTQFSFSEDPPTMTEKTKLVAGLNYTYITTIARVKTINYQ